MATAGIALLWCAMGLAEGAGVAILGSATGAAVDGGLAVRNLRVMQIPGHTDVEIQYDLVGAEGTNAWVRLDVSDDGGKNYSTPLNGLTGEVGRRVASLPNRRISWTVADSWLGHLKVQWVFRISANDGPLPPDAMVRISPGMFEMGSPEGESDRGKDEGPITEVLLTDGFWLGRCEVTQEEWQRVMGSNPSRFRGDPKLPVENVSWDECMDYCLRLTEKGRSTGQLPEKGWEYRLPTEAQWEYACRAGTRTATVYGDSLGSSHANFDGNYPYHGAATGVNLGKTVRTGSYPPNAWGLYDMHGNVWEWCMDWYRGSYSGGQVTNPAGPNTGSRRVFRGGCWYNFGQRCRSAYRLADPPVTRSGNLGFRVCLAHVL